MLVFDLANRDDNKDKKEVLEVEINFKTYYQFTSLLQELNKQGKGVDAGKVEIEIGQLVSELADKNLDALTKTIRCLLPKKNKATEADVVNVIDNYVADLVEDGTEQGDAYDTLFDDVYNALKNSGFFQQSAKVYLKTMEKGLQMAKKTKNPTVEQQQMLDNSEIVIGPMKDFIS